MISPVSHPSHPTAAWIKSTASEKASDCVDIAVLHATMGIRDSKRPTGSVLVFSFAGYEALIAGLNEREPT